jgi:hypothetical protein
MEEETRSLRIRGGKKNLKVLKNIEIFGRRD